MSSVDDPAIKAPNRWSIVAGGAIVPLAIVVAWWAVSAAGIVSPRLLPSPQDVVLAALDLAQRGLLVEDLAVSLRRVLLGFAAGSLVGVLLGAGIGRSRTARILFAPVIAAIRAVPTVAWLPVLLLYVGVGEAPKVALIAIGAAFPVFSALVGAYERFETPLAPAVVGGLRLGLAQSWVFLVAAELLHATAGIGFLLIDSSNGGRADRLLVGVALIVVLARLSDVLMAWLERRVRERSTSRLIA